mmetsp:Transcript_52336/g.124938  ORF Transcript_52336/g.124938 Transcript_52336/m.124938 type:complete len:944 (-) Transcript_52336:117-2948(-)
MAPEERGRSTTKRRTVAFLPGLDSDASSSRSPSPGPGSVSPPASPRRSLKRRNTRQVTGTTPRAQDIKRNSEPAVRLQVATNANRPRAKKRKSTAARNIAKIRLIYREAKHGYIALKQRKEKELRLEEAADPVSELMVTKLDSSSSAEVNRQESGTSDSIEAEAVPQTDGDEAEMSSSSADDCAVMQPGTPIVFSIGTRLQLGFRAMVGACRRLKMARLIIEECHARLGQRRAMQIQGLEANLYAESGDYYSVEDVLKRTAKGIEDEKTRDGATLDSGSQRLLEALQRSADHAKKLAALKDSVSQLAPLIKAIPHALQEIKSKIGQSLQSPEEVKEMKKMLTAVVEAENLLQQTKSMQGDLQTSVRSLNAGLSDVGCIAAPHCVLGHEMVWRAVEKEGKVFCDRCAASRCAREGVIPYVWRCEHCQRENRRFHYCKDCGDAIRDETSMQRLQPVEDFDYLMRIANDALTETQKDLGVEGMGNPNVADTLREIREAHAASPGDSEAQRAPSHSVSSRRASRRASALVRDSNLAGEDGGGRTPRSGRRSLRLEEDKRRRVSQMLIAMEETRRASRETTAPLDQQAEHAEHEDATKDGTHGDAANAEDEAEPALPHEDRDHLDEEEEMPDSNDSAIDSSDEESSDDGSDEVNLGSHQSAGKRRNAILGIVNLRICAKRLMAYARIPEEDQKDEEGQPPVETEELQPGLEVIAKAPVAPAAPPRRNLPRRPLQPPPVPRIPLKIAARSDAEEALDRLRREVLALNSPKKAPRPQVQGEPKDAANTALSARLPPLKPTLEYVPTTLLHKGLAGAPLKLPPVDRPRGWDSPRDMWPPPGVKASTLGHVRAPPRDKAPSAIGMSPRFEPVHETLVQESTLVSPRHPIIGDLRMKTVMWTPHRQHKIRGADPMAGSLFGREAKLDELSKERGLYQGQLAQRDKARREKLAL